MVRVQQDPDLFVRDIHEPGLLEEGIGIFAVGDGTACLTRSGVEVIPEFAEGGCFVRWTVRVVAARSPVDFDEFAEAAGRYVPFAFESERPGFSLFLSFLKGMVRAGVAKSSPLQPPVESRIVRYTPTKQSGVDELKVVGLYKPIVAREEVDLNEFEIVETKGRPVRDDVDADYAVCLFVSLGYPVGPPACASTDVEHAGVAIHPG